MKLKNEELWKKCIDNNKDPYGSAAIRFADRWATLMEGRIAKGENIYECAEETSHIADTEGITGFMYGAAVSMLSAVWEYGEDLRKWHNGEYNYKGEGVANPAVVTIDTEKL